MLFNYVGFDLYEKDEPKPEIIREGVVRYRGPRVDITETYWVCVGTAMTFGRFVDQPYPAILNKEFPTFNFGFGHLESRMLIRSLPHRQILQNADLIIIQYSPLPLYLKGLLGILSLAKASLIIAFPDIQPGDHTQFDNVLQIPGKAIRRYYPCQDTHIRAASLILEDLKLRKTSSQSNSLQKFHNSDTNHRLKML